MNINMTLVGQLVFFALFVWFCMRFVWPPITQALNERREKIAAGLAAAEQGLKQQARIEHEVADALQHAKKQASDIIGKAEKRGGEIIDHSKDEAKVEGERLIQAARAEIDKEINLAKEQLRKQVANLAVEGAQKILAKEVDSAVHATMLNDLAAKL